MKALMIIVTCLVAGWTIADYTATFGTGTNQFAIDFATIGNPGNPDDTTGVGGYDGTFNIGKHEVSIDQWNKFTRMAGDPSPSVGLDWTDENLPIHNITLYEAAQFCNWLTSGDRFKGVYIFDATHTEVVGIDKFIAGFNYSTLYTLPTEDQWYKAAYYTGSGYSLYANGTDIAPVAGADSQYGLGWAGQPWGIDQGMLEQNGTFNMMGNVAEWTESPYDANYPGMGIYGGSYDNYGTSEPLILGGSYSRSEVYLQAGTRNSLALDGWENHIGFRVAAIPEPSSVLLLMAGAGGLLAYRRSQRRGRSHIPTRRDFSNRF